MSKPTETQLAEQGWLLEKMHNGEVWYITVNQMLKWTNDPLKALRLSRREDAEMLASIVEDCEKIASHEWVPARTPSLSDAQPASASVPEQAAGSAFDTKHGGFIEQSPRVCMKCGHEEDGASGWCNAYIYGCGCQCEFPASPSITDQ